MEDLFAAIQRGDLDACRQLVVADPQRAASRNGQGISARLMALYCQQAEIGELLAGLGPAPDLLEAAALGNLDRLETCLASGQSAMERSGDGFTALHYGAYFGRPEIVARLLAEGVEVETSNGSGLKPLNSAVAGGHLTVVQLLLDHGANVNACQGGDITPLMGAAAGGHDAIVDLLLERGADVQRRCAAGKSAADYAEERGHGHLVSRLSLVSDPFRAGSGNGALGC